MPELPEVETVRKYLDNNIIGKKIIKINMSNKKSLRNVTLERLNDIVGQEIIETKRLGKNLIVLLEKDYLIFHLRMEGKFFIFKSIEEMNDKTNRFHDVMIMETENIIILFQDARKFATVDLFDKNISWEENSILSKVAKEPFNIKADDLFKILNKKNVSIKSCLLDQSIISGIGNIYADEILYAAKIHPETKSKNIDLIQVNKIIEFAIAILSEAIKLKGSTIRSYTSSLGIQGQFQNNLKVHQKKNSICKIDNGIIQKITVGGRGTFFCPNCQIKNIK